MNAPLTLPTGPLEHPAMDYAFLRQEGIRHLERMSGQLWSDFNAHDPGITILEQLCYAITDLGYRISHDLPDLLADGGDAGDPDLFGPAEILTCAPVSLSDLRKLVLDVEGVNNAWIEPVEQRDIALHYHPDSQELTLEADPPESEPVSLKGLYRVLIEPSDAPGEDSDAGRVRREVARRLHAHRGLCEDFEAIRVLDPQWITVAASVEVGPIEDAGAVLSEIYRKISASLSPRVAFLTLAQRLAAGKRVDEIFEGPGLEHGFIDSETLDRMQRRTSIHTSDLIQEIMSVPGVRAVQDIRIAADLPAGKACDTSCDTSLDEQQWKAWSLELDPERAPKLDTRNLCICLQKGQLAVAAKVEERYLERMRSTAASGTLAAAEQDLPVPRGRDRKVGHYTSIQHTFPALYGIGELGLPASAAASRKARARQLKAYLMFFDQLLANYFAQLAHVKDLFSFRDQAAHTYFPGMIEDPHLGLAEIRHEDPEAPSRLQAMTEPSVPSERPLQRKNRFLNHLLARFAEQFTDYALTLYGAMGTEADPPGEERVQEKLARDKQAFLQRYPGISSARGCAFNYLEPGGPANRSGLEERIGLKLGLVAEDEEWFYLVEHILLRPMEGDETQQVPILAATPSKDPYSLQLSFVFPGWPARFKEGSDFRSFIGQTVREETPAHLRPSIHWLSKDSMEAFREAHEHWLEQRRRYWTEKLGMELGA